MTKKADTKKVKATPTQTKSSVTKKADTKKVKATPTQTKSSVTKKASAKKVVVKKSPAKKVAAEKAPAKKVSVKKRSTPISSYQGRKGEKYMSAAMKKHFLAVLIDWREHLKEEMQKTFDHLKNKGESYADPIDRASQEEEFAFELRTRDRERKLTSKIAISLDQIKQGDYGYCYACGIEIGVKRLEARPTATHCIDCKTLDEIKEKQLGG
ncbi:RNA polymerase-binding protein DksA [Gammaproteobacteria bacterium]|nr:RNA polymerase-binding protein DksA [Gammaproteobacteria bacterium]